MKYSYSELAGMIDHALLHPTLTDQELLDGCQLCDRYEVATVCVKPYHVKKASEILSGSKTLVSCVIGFPHGSTTQESKSFETRVACEEGAREVDMVANIGKAMSGDWQYVKEDITGVVSEAEKHGAKVKVIFETDYLTNGGAGLSRAELVSKLCEVSEEAGAHWVKTSTGFGFVRQPEGGFACVGAQVEDIITMREACGKEVQVKASGGVRDLDSLVGFRNLGVTRCGTSATQKILDEYKRLTGDITSNTNEKTEDSVSDY